MPSNLINMIDKIKQVIDNDSEGGVQVDANRDTMKQSAKTSLFSNNAVIPIGTTSSATTIALDDEDEPKKEILRHFYDAMGLLPSDESDAYFEALRCAPNIVKKESKPIWFMRHEKLNAWAAAKRIASYWKARQKIFGKEKYLKPMHQTEDGALSPEAVSILESGSLSILPKMKVSGETVLLWDRDKLSSTQMQQSTDRLQAFFYISQLIMENGSCVDLEEDDKTHVTSSDSTSDPAGSTHEKSSAQVNHKQTGLVVIVILPLSARSSGSSFYEFTQTVVDVFQNGFPIHVKAMHLVSVPSIRNSTIWSAIASLIKQIIGSSLRQVAQVQLGNTAVELLQSLRSAGFEKRSLPLKIGGSWNEEKFLQFLKRRRRMEEEMFLSKDEKLKRKRLANMIHSRQKRERRKIEYEVIQEQSEALLLQNSKLKDEIKRRESLLEEAEKIIRTLQQEPVSNQPNRAESLYHSTGILRNAQATTVIRQQDEIFPTNHNELELLNQLYTIERNRRYEQCIREMGFRTQQFQNSQYSTSINTYSLLDPTGTGHGDGAILNPSSMLSTIFPRANDSQMIRNYIPHPHQHPGFLSMFAPSQVSNFATWMLFGRNRSELDNTTTVPQRNNMDNPSGIFRP